MYKFNTSRFLRNFIMNKKCRFNYYIEDKMMANSFVAALRFAKDVEENEFKGKLLRAVVYQMKLEELDTNYLWTGNCGATYKRFMRVLIFVRHLHMMLRSTPWYSVNSTIDILKSVMPDLDVELFRRINGITNSSDKAVLTYYNTWNKLLRKYERMPAN